MVGAGPNSYCTHVRYGMARESSYGTALVCVPCAGGSHLQGIPGRVGGREGAHRLALHLLALCGVRRRRVLLSVKQSPLLGSRRTQLRMPQPAPSGGLMFDSGFYPLPAARRAGQH